MTMIGDDITNEECKEKMAQIINKIIKGDCIEEMAQIPSNQIDLVVTSPPYNLDIQYDNYNDNIPLEQYKNFIREVAVELHRIIKNDGRVCINIPCDGKMKIQPEGEKEKCDISYLIKEIFYSVGFFYRDKIYWDKGNVKNRMAIGSCGSASSPNILLPFEEIVVFHKKNRIKAKDDKKSDITKQESVEYSYGHWKIAGRKGSEETCPVPFPEEIPYRLIKEFSYIDDVILDPFCGSGTTCVVAKKLKRRYIGIEQSQRYVDNARIRIQKVE